MFVSMFVDSEMFPLLNSDKPNTAELMQVWLNLPRKSKMVKPGFTMHWSEEVPLLRGETGARITLWAGELFGATALPPPPESYASDPRSDLLILNIRLPPGASCVLPAARSGSAAHRAVYFYEGPALEIAGENVPSRRMLVVDAAAPVSLRNTAAPGGVECGAFVLQGVPIGEPVVQRGPFVMNSAQEIQQAYMDYQRTQFGKWTFADDGPVFGATKGRFANQDGVETTPPAAKQ